MSTPPYMPPNKPTKDYTAEEARAWLENYFATAPERQKQSDRFYNSAVIWLGAGLLVPVLAILLASSFSK